MPPLDHDHCYAAASSRDARFDGTFVTAVRTTGIYCRPSCPAVTPKRSNVEFHHTAAAAQQRGFRACKRCRPDASPGSPEWNVRQDLVGRAMRLIADGVVERSGVPGLAARLGYSERHLNRLLTSEVGAGPLALARARRAQTARVLVETTDMPLTDVAFAAGFGSVRQFNDTMREVFDAAPRDLRRSALRRGGRAATSDRTHLAEWVAKSIGSGAPVRPGTTTVGLRLPVRAPFPLVDTLDFVGRRAIPGVETYDVGPAREHEADGGGGRVVRRYRRLLRLPHGPGSITIEADRSHLDPDGVRSIDHVVVSVELTDVADLGTAVERTRRLLDLDADPVSIDEHLATTRLAEVVRRRPGRRSPAGADPFETLVRAIIGQQISVSGARTVAARLAEACDPGPPTDGPPLGEPPTGGTGLVDPTRCFPDASAVAGAPDEAFSMPTSRRDTLRRVASRVADGSVPLHVGADPDEVRSILLDVKGIGPWTADYVLLRGLAHPDVLLAGDLGVRHGAARIGLDDLDRHASGWAPWSSYATHHLWAALDDPPDVTAVPGEPTSTDPNGETR